MKKRILSFILCVMMIIPCFVWNISARTIEIDGKEVEFINIAPNGKTYHSSVWNQDGSARYLNNGILYSSWQFWRPGSKERPDTPYIDDSLQYIGMKFNNYYTFDEVVIYGHRYGTYDGGFCGKCYKYIQNDEFTTHYKEVSGQQQVDKRTCNVCDTPILKFNNEKNNIKFTIQVLVQGQWIEAGHGYNNDMEYVVNKDGEIIGEDLASVTIKLDKVFPAYDAQGNIIVDENGEPILTNLATSKNIKVECSEYGAYSLSPGVTSHDWWKVPLLQEVEINGFQTINKPKFDVPEGAEVVSDAALGGMANATTSAQGQYPLLGNDRNGGTMWRANDYEGQSYWVDFDKDYSIKDVKLNFGGMHPSFAGSEYEYDVFVKKNGEWVLLASDTVTTEGELWRDEDMKVYSNNDEFIGGVKVTYKSSTKEGEVIAPCITELSALIANGEQCVFLSGYLDSFRASSSAQGNIACYGEAYCSSSMDYSNISDITYINDGQVTDDAFSWYAQNFLKGTYCGIKLKEIDNVTKVVLYFNDVITGGKDEEHVMEYDVQALVNGEYVTIASATSYDPTLKSPIISIELDEAVTTDDVRIVFQSNGLVFPHLKEMEIYSGDKVYGAYQGYQLDLSMRTLHGRYPTTSFAQKTVVGRAKYMNLVSPIEHLILAAQYGIDPADIK